MSHPVADARYLIISFSWEAETEDGWDETITEKVLLYNPELYGGQLELMDVPYENGLTEERSIPGWQVGSC